MFDTEKFICEIQNRPCIWNTKEKYFSNRVIKKGSWEEIAKIFDPTWDTQTIAKQQEYVDELQKKWKHIRDYYVKQKRGKLKIISNRRGTASYMDLLTFLDVNIEPEAPSCSIDDQQEVPVQYESEDSHEKPLDSPNDEDDPAPSSNVSNTIHFKEEVTNSANKKPKNESASSDADTIFLLSLLPQVSSLSERQNCEFRMEVMNLLYKIKYRTPYTYYRTGAVVKKRRRHID